MFNSCDVADYLDAFEKGQLLNIVACSRVKIWNTKDKDTNIYPARWGNGARSHSFSWGEAGYKTTRLILPEKRSVLAALPLVSSLLYNLSGC